MLTRDSRHLVGFFDHLRDVDAVVMLALYLVLAFFDTNLEAYPFPNLLPRQLMIPT